MVANEPNLFTYLLDASTRQEAIDIILMHLAADGQLLAKAALEIRERINRRETLGSTAIGNGIAVPHGRHEIEWTTLGLALLKKPVHDWSSIDGEPVDLVFLLVAPAESPKSLQSFFERLWRAIARGPGDRLRQATSPEELALAFRALAAECH